MSDHKGHDEVRLLLGAYVLGGLEIEERTAVDRHLEHCAPCRREVADFAVVPGLLARGAEPEPEVEPGADVRRATVEAAAREATGDQGRRGRLAWGAGLLAACSLAVGVLGGVAWDRSEPTQQATPAVARTLSLSGPAESADADLVHKAWGTELHLEMAGVQAAQRLVLVAVGPNRQEHAATWTVPEGGRFRVVGATSMPVGSVSRVEVRTEDGTVIATSSPVSRSVDPDTSGGSGGPA